MRKLVMLLVSLMLLAMPAVAASAGDSSLESKAAAKANGVLHYFRNVAGNTVNSAAEMLIGSDMALDLVNGYVKRYAVVKKIAKKGSSVSCSVLPNGSKELVGVTARKIVFADDNSTVRVNDLSANVEWLDHILKDFVQGKPYTIPKENRDIVGQVKKLF